MAPNFGDEGGGGGGRQIERQMTLRESTVRPRRKVSLINLADRNGDDPKVGFVEKRSRNWFFHCLRLRGTKKYLENGFSSKINHRRFSMVLGFMENNLAAKFVFTLSVVELGLFRISVDAWLNDLELNLVIWGPASTMPMKNYMRVLGITKKLSRMNCSSNKCVYKNTTVL